MRTSRVKQRSPQWHQLRKGSIGGTRYGQAVSNRKNKLLYDLVDEQLSDFVMEDGFINQDIQFGIDNEPFARKLYIKQSGIRFSEVGMIFSDFSHIHHGSPDGLNRKLGIVLEIKCTQSGSTQVKRFFEGIDTEHLPQIISYFVLSDSVREVHWVSYCPFRTERPMVVYIVKREDYLAEIEAGRARMVEIEQQVNEMKSKFTF